MCYSSVILREIADVPRQIHETFPDSPNILCKADCSTFIILRSGCFGSRSFHCFYADHYEYSPWPALEWNTICHN